MKNSLGLGCALLMIGFAVQAHEQRLPLSLAEVETKLAAGFATIDADGDGLILPAEWNTADVRKPAAFSGPLARAVRRRAFCRRANGGQRNQDSGTVFNKFDHDGNGSISPEEFSAHVEKRRQGNWCRGEQAMQPVREQMFAQLDLNQDGVLTMVEFSARLEQLRALDANGDGQLDRDELFAGRDGHRRR